MNKISVILVVLLVFVGCTPEQKESYSLEWWDNYVRHLNEVLVNRAELDRIPEFISDAYTVHTADTSYSSSSLVFNFIADLRSAFPDLVVETEVLGVDGDTISWIRKHTGTFRGEFMGVQPTGQVLEWQAVVITRFEDGLAVEDWGASSLGSLLLSQ